MNRDEAIVVISAVRAACPQQAAQMDAVASEGIIEMWWGALADTDVRAAVEAIPRILRRTAWIAPVDIVREVAREASNRYRDAAALPAPSADPDDPAAWRAALIDQRRRAMYGPTTDSPSIGGTR